MADYAISLLCTQVESWGEVWVEREGSRDRKKLQREQKKRVEEALNQDAERSWHKDKKHSSKAPGV